LVSAQQGHIGKTMLRVIFRLVKNEDGFTATELGLMVALTVMAMERLLIQF